MSLPDWTEANLFIGRSPTWSDFNQMPYVNCIVKEGMRWRPVYDSLWTCDRLFPLTSIASQRVCRTATAGMMNMKEC